jgi:DNA-binding sugar fermentation-stimulating protein
LFLTFLGDEFLLIMLALVLERQNRHVAEIDLEGELRHRLVHLLFPGNMNHSGMMKNISIGMYQWRERLRDFQWKVA